MREALESRAWTDKMINEFIHNFREKHGFNKHTAMLPYHDEELSDNESIQLEGGRRVVLRRRIVSPWESTTLEEGEDRLDDLVNKPKKRPATGPGEGSEPMGPPAKKQKKEKKGKTVKKKDHKKKDPKPKKESKPKGSRKPKDPKPPKKPKKKKAKKQSEGDPEPTPLLGEGEPNPGTTPAGEPCLSRDPLQPQEGGSPPVRPEGDPTPVGAEPQFSEVAAIPLPPGTPPKRVPEPVPTPQPAPEPQPKPRREPTPPPAPPAPTPQPAPEPQPKLRREPTPPPAPPAPMPQPAPQSPTPTLAPTPQPAPQPPMPTPAPTPAPSPQREPSPQSRHQKENHQRRRGALPLQRNLRHPPRLRGSQGMVTVNKKARVRQETKEEEVTMMTAPPHPQVGEVEMTTRMTPVRAGTPAETVVTQGQKTSVVTGDQEQAVLQPVKMTTIPKISHRKCQAPQRNSRERNSQGKSQTHRMHHQEEEGESKRPPGAGTQWSYWTKLNTLALACAQGYATRP